MIEGRNRNGYVKICASWARTLWGGRLSDPTEIFDSCGVYDDEGTPVPKPSQSPEWDTALKFLEWYQVPLMDGFGIIIVDDENEGQYAKVKNLGYTTDCYKSAKRLLAAGKLLLLSGMMYVMSI